MLYRRPACASQLEEMHRCCIQTYANLWIVGSTGVGKSCMALAFACSLDRLSWDVIWIHYAPNPGGFNCVWLHRDKTVTCTIEQEQVEHLAQLLGSTSEFCKALVILDNYYTSLEPMERARQMCERWHLAKRGKHRLMYVCSMVGPSKIYRPDLCRSIPTQVDDKGKPVDMQDDTDMKNEMLFEVDSWRLDEYKAAVSDETFFRSIMDVFPVSTSSPRMTLLEEKHFIVGGNARLMFDVSTDTAMQTFDFAIQSASNIETYLNGYYGETSFDPTNQLLSRYYTKHNDDDVRILSRFVMRRLAMKLGPQFVTKFTQAFS